MNPLVSTILLWERRLELPPHQRHVARHQRFEDDAKPSPEKDGSRPSAGGFRLMGLAGYALKPLGRR